jgi:demethylmenaquinone methyltransferase/2-methoxy-6-polyprenyl-1,4-benzoquinol methylase
LSTLALMRWLEATPGRYDAGMRVITLGRVTALHDAVAAAATPESGGQVLEIGCGTGAVTRRLLERGARVTALDQSPEMLEQARRRIAAASDAQPDRVCWLERTASEIDGLPRAGFDSVVLSLCLSEMSRGERRFVLIRARERLRPGGLLVAADEVCARGLARPLWALARVPQALLGWLLAGATSRPLRDLRGEVEDAGLRVSRERRWLAGTLALVVAECAG